MSEIKVIGKVKFVGQEIKVSETSDFTKRELVVTTEEQYPQHILINFPQGKCNDKLDLCAVGAPVDVFVNLRGREWVNPQGETKYFKDIQGWKIDIKQNLAPTSTQAFVFTATDGTEAAYRQAGWTTEQMVEHKKGHYVASAPQAPAVPSSQKPPVVLPPDANSHLNFKEEEHDDLPF